jgi:hypothetical protein
MTMVKSTALMLCMSLSSCLSLVFKPVPYRYSLSLVSAAVSTRFSRQLLCQELSVSSLKAQDKASDGCVNSGKKSGRTADIASSTAKSAAQMTKRKAPAASDAKKKDATAKLKQASISSMFGKPAAQATAVSTTTKAAASQSATAEGNKESLSLSSMQSTSTAHNKTQSQSDISNSHVPHRFTHIYCDLDGVLVDFEGGIARLFGRPSKDVAKPQLFARIARTPNFFQNLGWTRDGPALWDTLLQIVKRDGLALDILTGITQDKTAVAQKATWCRRELKLSHPDLDVVLANRAGPKREHSGTDRILAHGKRPMNRVHVITCWTRNKHLESRPGR